MSHFTCLVITKEGQDPEDLLAPFSENMEVEEYEEDCYCAESNLNAAVKEHLEKEFGDFDTRFRQPYNALPFDGRPTWIEYIVPYTDRIKELEQELRSKKKPNKDCEECQGTGSRKTTYNPNSKWDYYSPGGRWKGDLKLKQGVEGENYVDTALFKNIDWDGMKADTIAERTKRWNEAHDRLAKGEIPENDLDWHYGMKPGMTKENYVGGGEFSVFSIITSDGHWQEKGNMGWFGMVSDEKEPTEWSDIIKNILSECRPTDRLSIYDLHI